MENPETRKLQLKMVDQISIAVKDIDKVIESWSSMFGIGPWSFTDIGGTDAKGHSWKARMAFAYLGPVQVELVQPVEGRIFQSRFLDNFGEGLHHLGFYVDDVDGEVSNLVAQGVKLLLTDPGNFAYLESGGPGGVIFELMRRVS